MTYYRVNLQLNKTTAMLLEEIKTMYAHYIVFVLELP